MDTYRDYLLTMIAESSEDDEVKEIFIETVIGATDVDELDTIEEYLEKAEADDLTLKELQDSNGGTSADNDGKNKFTVNDIPGYNKAEEEYEKGLDIISDGDIMGGLRVCILSSKKIAASVNNAIRSVPEKDVKNVLEDVSERLKEFQKECESGDITASEAMTCGRKILVKLKLAAKKAATLLTGRTLTRESTINAVFEAAADGYLSSDELVLMTSILN